MDEGVLWSLLQQIVDGLAGVQAAIEHNTEIAERDTAWLGERLEDVRMAIIGCEEKLGTEGCYVQDRLNEVKKALEELPGEIGAYMN